jgi:tripartite-type tricarboxylate transporter receptor subunit TctC
MDMKGRKIIWLMSGILLFTFSGLSLAQEKYPTRPIELVVPFGPGGSADLAARCYSDDLAKILNATINVVNRAGGTGIQGTSYVINGKKDGYTLLGTTDTPLLIMPVISKEATYDPLKDVIPIGRFAHVYSIFAVRSDSPFKTLPELIDYARKNPGKLKNGAAGLGTESQFNLMVLCSKAKFKVTTIPFESGGENLAALLGGHVDMSSSSVASLGKHIQSGKLRGLAISSTKRHPEFPNIPTTTELGYPESNLAVWTGVLAPTGVPKQVVDVLVPAVQKAFNNPEVIKRALNLGMVFQYMGPEELRKNLEADIKIIKEVAAEAGLTK